MTTKIHDDIYSPEVTADPFTYYGRLREESPVHWNAKYQTWLVTLYEDVVWLIRHPEIFSSENFRRTSHVPPQPPIAKSDDSLFDYIRYFRTQEFIQHDPPHHTRMRGVINKAFTPKAIEQWRDLVRAVVNEMLDSVEKEGRMDVMATVAQPLPLRIISHLLGVPEDDRVLIKDLAHKRMAGVFGVDEHRMQTSFAGIKETSAYLSPFIEDRIEHSKGDLLSILATGEKEGLYSRGEVMANAQSLIDAGHETTIRLISNGITAFMRNRDQWDIFRTDPEGLAVVATEECLRYDPPLESLPRICARDVELHGQKIKAGQRVTYVVASANRDPRVFENPDKFDIKRYPNKHIAFGGGVHYCLGQYLARLEGQEVFVAMAKRFPKLQLEADPNRFDPTWRTRAIRSLWASWK